MKKKPMEPTKKILLPVDGSERCLETVKYVARYAPFHSMKAVLFNVFSDVPECYWDLEREPKSVKAALHVRAWVSQKKKEMEEYMEKARQILLRGGFAPDAISVQIQSRKKGVARDILKEAQRRYTAVVLRRRGATGLRNIVMGSVATKLMERLTFCPLIIVGRKPVTRRVLIGMDGSEGASHAVDFVAKILNGQDFSAHLVNVIRETCTEVAGEEGEPSAPVQPLKAEEEIVPVLEDAKARLLEAGFTSDRVSWRVITGVKSRAAALAEEAEKQHCETIVVGRRGLSTVKQFFIGRVSNKVVQLARKNTVWVVT